MRKTNTTHRMKIFGVDDLLIGAAISSIGSIGTGLFNMSSTEKTNEANAKQAQMNRDFQERMSSTAYQRGMADMKLAGLNPILAYQKGGASSPTGAQAAFTAPKIEGNPLGEAVNTGLTLRQKSAELANLQQQNKNLQATEHQIAADTILKNATSARTMSEDRILGDKKESSALEAAKAKIDQSIYQNSAGSTLRKAGTIAQETNRTAEPLVNNASKLLRGYNDTRTRRSTTETNHYQDQSFTERFHY